MSENDAYGTVVERGHCQTATLRRARKRHRCECGDNVQPGEDYLLHKGFPGHDGLSDLTAPMVMVECRACAERYGRGHLLPSLSSDSGTIEEAGR